MPSITVQFDNRTARLLELTRRFAGDPSGEDFILRVVKEAIDDDSRAELAIDLENAMRADRPPGR